MLSIFQTGHQEDAEEFLGFFLDTLEEELLVLSSANSKTVQKDDEAGGDEWLEVGRNNCPACRNKVHSLQCTCYLKANN